MHFQELFIDENQTVLEAMKQLDEVSRGILYLVNPNQVLLAALTDGDIRRHLLDGGQLDSPIKEIANYQPKFLYEEERELAEKVMQEKHILSIPILNKNSQVKRICFMHNREEIKEQKDLNLPVVMMAGGKGTRLYPYTKVLPKPLIPVGELPIAEHIMNKFIDYGCDNFHLIVNHKKQMIKAYFSETSFSNQITYYDEDQPLGTGGGLSLIKGAIDSPFFLTNCDIIVKADYSDILNYHKKSGNTITIVCAYKHVTIPYGVITMGEGGDIQEMIEKPEYSFLTNTGFYLVEPDVLERIPQEKFLGFPDIIETERNLGNKVSIYPVSEKSWLDMGQLEELENMRKELGE